MKTITVHVDELEYAELQRNARRRGQSASELLRQAIQHENARQNRSQSRSLADALPAKSVGAVLKPWANRGDLLEGYLDRK